MNENHFKSRLKLGDILSKQGLISKEQLDIAMKYQQKNYQKLGRILIKLGFISDKELCETLAKQLSIPIVDLDEVDIDKEAYSLIPPKHASDLNVLPLHFKGNELIVAFSDPLDYDAYQSIVFKTGHSIKQVIANKEQLKSKISDYYNIDLKDTSIELSLKELRSTETPSTKAATDIIWHINGILKKIQQYSFKSLTVKNAIKWAYENIGQYLKKFGSFNLYINDEDPFVNGELLPNRDYVQSFISFLNKVYLNTFIIEDGLTIEEFTNLITILNHCFSHPDDYSRISTLFRESGIINAKLGEINYTTETVTLNSENELLNNYLDGKISLISVIGKITSLILDSPNIILDALKAKKISLQEQKLNFEEQKEAYSKMIYKLIRILTLEDDPMDSGILDNKVENILSQLDSIDILDALLSDQSSPEQKKALEQIILKNPGNNNFKNLYYHAQELLDSSESFYSNKRNVIKSLIIHFKPFANFTKKTKNRIKVSVNDISEKEEKSKSDRKENKLFEIEKEIERGNMDVIDKTFDNILIDNPVFMKGYDEKKSDILSFIIMELLSRGYMYEVEDKLKQLHLKFKNAQDVHSFSDILDTYQKIFIPIIKSNLDSSFLKIASYSMDYYKKIRQDEDKKYFRISINNFFKSISTEKNIYILTNLFKSKEAEEKNKIIEFIKILDEFAIVPIIKRLKNSNDRIERLTLIEILVRAENKSVGLLLEELVMQNPWFVVRNVVLILGRVGNPIATGFLKKALTHEDLRVKKEAFHSILKFKNSNVEDIVGGLLDSPNFDTQCRAVRILGKLKSEKNSYKLRKILVRRRKTVQEEFKPIYSYVCHSLGKIKDVESVLILLDIAKPKLFSKKWTTPKFRASACWALGKIGGNRAYEALEKLKSDSEIIVSKTALHALKKNTHKEN